MSDDGFGRLYIFAAALAGAITSLSFMQWQKMSWGEISLTVFVGFTFAMFAVPWIAADIAGMNLGQTRAICGIVYLGGTGANMLIPLMLQKAKRRIGLEGDGA